MIDLARNRKPLRESPEFLGQIEAMPWCVDLFSGLGGWTDGFLAEGYRVTGYDIEAHEYGEHRYPAQLVLADVLTLHGSMFKDAACIVASPPCQKYSYMAMPWSRGKAIAAEIRADESGEKLRELNALFDACFRIQREACQAAGRHIPMVVENVKGAQPWVGRARWSFGSYFLWGDVPALMPVQKYHQRLKVREGEQWNINRANFAGTRGWDGGVKKSGQNWSRFAQTGEKSPQWNEGSGHKVVTGWFNDRERTPDSISSSSSSSLKRKQASAMIAKIPEPLSRHIARCFKP